MIYAQLHFLGMTDYIRIDDNQTHYIIDLPVQKVTLDNFWKEKSPISEIKEKLRLIFVIFPNKYHETDKDNAPECIAEFSHVEIIK